MTIRAVVFDLDGVLCRHEDSGVSCRWEARCGLPEGGLRRLFSEGPIARRSLMGKATIEEAYAEFWVEVQRRFSLTSDELEAWRDEARQASMERKWDDELLAFIQALRPGVRTGLISNAWVGTREKVKEHIHSRTFDVILFSAEEGVAKPDAEIYRRALSRLGVAAEEVIFVDDWPPNLESARAIGIHALRFTGSLAVREEINRLMQ